jgi:mannose-6-phosphate isomerase-like protein (cupin superfamily)
MTTLAELSQTQLIPRVRGENFTAIHVGKLADLPQYTLESPRTSHKIEGKLFIKDHLNLTGMQVSLNKLPAGAAIPFYHKHKQNEELYIFIGGKGQMQVDNELIDIEEGSCIRIATNGERTWRNNSNNDLYYIVIQAKEDSLSQDTFDDGIPVERPIEWA